MLTRRENLLIRPWQERRYINHRIKLFNSEGTKCYTFACTSRNRSSQNTIDQSDVLSVISPSCSNTNASSDGKEIEIQCSQLVVETALPVIDNNPPPYRHHVNCKMKKFQKEKERCTQIISDNFTLLQHLAHITRTTRVDNVWEEPPPNFLNRVGIYSCRRKSCSEMDDVSETLEEPKTRKEKCFGCSPHRLVSKVSIPEERVPFPPPKQKLSRKLQSPPDSVAPKPRKTRSAGDERKPKGQKKNLETGQEKRQRSKKKLRHLEQETQSLLLSRGCLTLKLHFPSDSAVVFSDKGRSKVIQKEICHCAASFATKL